MSSRSLTKDYPKDPQFVGLHKRINDDLKDLDAMPPGKEMTPDSDSDPPASRLDGIDTRWSLIREAHLSGAAHNATAARQVLVLRYAKAIRRYVGGIVKSSADADELSQDAILRLMAGDFAGADPNRGRFRDLLKTAVRNMVHNHWAKSNRRRAAALDVDVVASADQPDAEWDAAWRQAVLDLAWAGLREHQRENPGNHAHTLLRLRIEFPDIDSDALAAKLAEKTGTPVRADACRQMLRRARLRFAEVLVREIGLGLADPAPQRVRRRTRRPRPAGIRQRLPPRRLAHPRHPEGGVRDQVTQKARPMSGHIKRRFGFFSLLASIELPGWIKFPRRLEVRLRKLHYTERLVGHSAGEINVRGPQPANSCPTGDRRVIRERTAVVTLGVEADRTRPVQHGGTRG